MKFSLSGNKGLGIFAAGSPSSGTVACNSSDPASDLTETVTAGSSLSYDPTTDRYNYLWKTDPSWTWYLSTTRSGIERQFDPPRELQVQVRG